MRSPDPDGALLEAWSQGDRAAGAELFDRHFGALSRFFANKAGEAADDLIQQTLLGCLEARDRFRAASSFRTFLFAIARNVLFSHYRGTRRDPREFDASLSAVAQLGPGPATLLVAADRERALLEGLRCIPLQFQIVLELTFWEQMTAAQIGEVVGAPEGTVRTRLRRAKELLAKELRRIEKLDLPLETTIHRLDDWAAKVRAALP